MRALSMSISVVIPLYNKSATISACISSVMQQSYTSWECIVIDDGCTDDSPDKARVFDDPRVTVISQSNRGLSEARNTGIRAATHDLIAFLDADDLWDDNHLQCLADLAERYPNANLIANRYRILRENGSIALPSFAPELILAEDQIVQSFWRAVVLGDNVFMPSATSLRRSALERVGLFRHRFGEDTDMWLRMALDGEVVLGKATTMSYRLYHNDPTSTGRKPRTLEDLDAPHFTEWPKLTATMDDWYSEFVAKKQIQQLTYFYLSGFGKEVRTYLHRLPTRRFRRMKYTLWLKSYFPPAWVLWASHAKQRLRSTLFGRKPREGAPPSLTGSGS